MREEIRAFQTKLADVHVIFNGGFTCSRGSIAPGQRIDGGASEDADYNFGDTQIDLRGPSPNIASEVHDLVRTDTGKSGFTYSS